MTSIVELLHKTPNDEFIYLLSQKTKEVGFFATAGKLLLLEKNVSNMGAENVDTEYLSLKMNINITGVENCQSFEAGSYNLLIFKGDVNDKNFEVFFRLCNSYCDLGGKFDIVKFFFSLTDLFQSSKEQDYKNLIGLYGELKVIEYFHREIKVNLANYWHTSGSHSKYDFSMEKINIEVKTSSVDEDIVSIKHDQLFRENNNLLAFVKVSENSYGKSLNELTKELVSIPEIATNFNFMLELEKEKIRVSPTEAKNIKLDCDKISLYEAVDLNLFGEIPLEIARLNYDLDLTDFAELKVQDLKKIIICGGGNV